MNSSFVFCARPLLVAIAFFFLSGIPNSASARDAEGRELHYYNSIDFDAGPSKLKKELKRLITNTHTHSHSYRKNWPAMEFLYASPKEEEKGKVKLVYGHDDEDGNKTTDKTRDIRNHGGGSGEWNREHVLPKSKGGPVTDLLNLKPSDVKQNNYRGNKRFSEPTNNSGCAHKTSNEGWYPGDEWRGDVARVLLYLKLRYNKNLKDGAEGPTNSDGVPLLLLKWHQDDPPSDYERLVNDRMANEKMAQGNRNPFIDIPDLPADLGW